MEVELSLHPYRKKSMPGKIFVRAKNVSMPGGAAIAIQDQVDADKKTFVGGQHLRYSGLLEWYSIQRGFGYVKMDDGFDMGGETVPKSLKVEQAEVNAGGKEIPSKMKEIQVEFSIWKTLKGEYRVYNMTLPGMMPITASALENRKVWPGQEFKGTVQQNWWQQGYGQIQVAEGAVLPEPVKAKMKGDLLYFRNADVKVGQWLKKGMEVTFQVYTDDKGCGACEVAGPERDAMET
jgi:cold shock CspA family protein